MADKTVYSICGMCTVRCPIAVHVRDNEVAFIQGNPFDPGMAGGLCARGAAGAAFITDDQRPQYPMIRVGARGEGKWRRATWDEALDHVAERLKGIMAEHGPRSVLWSDRGGPFVDLHKAFMAGLGSPNYCNHDVSCARNVLHAAKSVMGLGRKDVSYDFKNCRHLVLQTRNIFEAINVKEVNGVLDGKANGMKLTVIDTRATVSAAKADELFMVRPGTDYALNLAVLHVILTNDWHDKAFCDMHVKDLDVLRDFVAPCTPAWAEAETGIKAARIERLAKDLKTAAPAVIWHPGWMTARYTDSFYVSRTAYLINAVLGAIGAKGGLPITNKAADYGKKGLTSLASLVSKPDEKRADGAGWRLRHIDSGPGLLTKAFEAAVTGDPYPVKAYIAFRHDPLHAMPDPEALKQSWKSLDFIVSITWSWCDTAWNADVFLPLSPYLERESILAHKGGLKPHFFRRARALTPRYDTRSEWEILCGLAKRLGVDALAFESIEDIWNHQLQGTGMTIEDFDATGQVWVSDEPLYRTMEDLKFKTPSGRIEVVNQTWEDMGLPSLKPYESPKAPPEGAFRLTFGRCALHTQGHTVNNPMLNRQMPVNPVWIHTSRAADLGIEDGDAVVVAANGYQAETVAQVTDYIHPECVFLVHGFGHKLPPETRSRRGVADQELMPGGLTVCDPAGGSLAMQEHFVTVSKV